MNKLSTIPSGLRRGMIRIASGSRRGFSKRAFTLVEILVSVTVLSLMILFLFSVFNLASQAWQSSEKKVDAFREARAALFVMRRDLGGLQVATNLPMALNQNLVPNLGTMTQPADQLFFLSSLGSDMQGGNLLGDVCAVGYYVGWATNSFQPSGANQFASQSYNLFRYFMNSETNFASLTNFWAATNLSNLYRNASTQPQSGDEVLARNVVGFRVRPYYWQNVVSVTGGVTNTNSVLFSTNTGSAQDAVVLTNRPAFLDISMTVINYATAAQLGNSTAQWNQRIADPNANSLVNQNKQEFYLRVPLTP